MVKVNAVMAQEEADMAAEDGDMAREDPVTGKEDGVNNVLTLYIMNCPYMLLPCSIAQTAARKMQ
jgi:hypothetical protein